MFRSLARFMTSLLAAGCLAVLRFVRCDRRFEYSSSNCAHLILVNVLQAKREEMQALWRQACDLDDEQKQQDVDFRTTRQDKTWFCRKYCGGLGLDRDATDSMWDLLATLEAPRDLLALLACVTNLRNRFFNPSHHHVVAKNSANATVTKHLIAYTRKESADSLRGFLLEMLQSGLSLEAKSALEQKARVVMITDIGQDLDDEMTVVLLRALTDRGIVECKGSVATLAPARARARLLRGTFDELGLTSIPVAIGTDGGFTKHTATFEKTSSSYIAGDDASFSTLPGLELLMQLYSAAAPLSIDLLIIASLKDAAEFMRAHERLFRDKTHTVTIMGGVMPFDDDENTLLTPDTAHNNQFCADSSSYVYRRCQELKVPMIIVSRHAAYATPMPRWGISVCNRRAPILPLNHRRCRTCCV